MTIPLVMEALLSRMPLSAPEPEVTFSGKNVSAAPCPLKMNLRAALRGLAGGLFTLFLG
jgi:hypothetical protein